MKSTRVTSALIAAGILASSVAAAAAWNPSEWLQKAVAVAPAAGIAPPAATAAVSSAPIAAPIAPVSAPNYRAIVQRYGPAVVGINTAGTVRTACSMPEGAEDDPMSRLFRGMPGVDAPTGKQLAVLEQRGEAKVFVPVSLG